MEVTGIIASAQLSAVSEGGGGGAPENALTLGGETLQLGGEDLTLGT